MNSLILLSFVLALVLLNPVYGEICDNDCLLQRSRVFYKKVVNGIDGLLEPSDPLYSDEINGKSNSLKYRQTNVILTGLKNCENQKYVIRKTAVKDTLCYECTLSCPKLVLKYNFETNGKFEPVDIARKGNVTFTLTNYVIIFKGKLIKFISEDDDKTHFCMKLNGIETEAKGKLLLESSPQNKTEAKTEETLEYLNGNRETLENFLECPIMTHLMKILNERQNTYLRTLPADKVFPE